MEFENKICIAKIIKTHGYKGDLKLLSLTDNNERFNHLKTFYIQGYSQIFTCENVRITKNDVFLKIENINSMEEAMKFNGKQIFVDRKDAVKLKENEFYYADLLKCKVYNKDKLLGIVVDIENYGASDILIVKNKNRILNVPFILDMIENFNYEKKILYVNDRFYEVAV